MSSSVLSDIKIRGEAEYLYRSDKIRIFFELLQKRSSKLIDEVL
jgi:hypothetical protein